jgi:hypothetical protein
LLWQLSARGPLRHFAATQQFGCFRMEADIERAALTEPGSASMYGRIIALQLCLPASAAIVRGTASLLASARFPQKKVLEDELAIAGRKRCTASLAI